MKATNKLLLFVWLLLSPFTIFSQLQNIRIPFEHLSTREGLISNRVTSIILDSMGFYWYGTSLGLNRHDGNQLELFRHEDDNPNSLPEDYVKFLIVANRYVIAGLTSSGELFIYDYRNQGYNTIKRIPLASSNHNPFKAETITSDGESLFAINSTGDIVQVNIANHQSHVLFAATEATIEDVAIAIYHSGRLWIGSANGLYTFHPTTCTLTKKDLSFYSSNSHGNASVSGIEPYDDNHFLLSSSRSAKFPFKGIIMFNHVDYTDKPLCLSGIGKNFDDYAVDIVKKLKGSVLFIRINTVSRFIYDIETHIWDTLAVRSNHTRYLNTSSLNCVASEQNGRYRIGSNQGIFIHLPEISMFEEYYPHKDIFYARQWTGLYRDDTKNLYVGTQSAINVYHKPTKQLTNTTRHPCVQDHHRVNQQPSLIELDSSRLLVLASYLSTYDIHHHNFTIIENDSSSQLPAAIQSNLFPYTLRKNECFFVRDGRLYRVDLQSLTIHPIPIYDTVGSEAFFDASGIAFDAHGFLWMTTYNKGLVRCHPEKGEYISFSLYDNRCPLNDIIIDSSNVVWIASNGCGLIKVNIDSPSLLHYGHFSRKEGYVTSILHQLMEDNDGRIWSTSSYGINYYDKKSGNVYNFSKAHGIEYPHNFFRGKTQDLEGNFYVSGGINIVKIDPKKFQQVTRPPPVYIKQFQINNNPVASFWKDTSITISAQENNFSFQLSAISHIHPKLNKYKYKLENFHSDWITTDHSQLFIPFTNLDAGMYTFKVIASNHEGVWNHDGISIIIRILPYFHETWWFRMAIAVAILGLIYFIFRQHTERLLAIQRIDIEKKTALEAERSRISRDMHDDLGSGLSAIHLLSNYLNENASEKYPEFSTEIDKIRRSSEELNESIREIIWTVNVKDDTLNSLVLFIRRYCHELHEKMRTPVYVHADDPVPDVTLSGAQRKHIFLCLKESLNNALKHGNPTEINVYVKCDSKMEVLIRIHDNGTGFNTAAMPDTPLGNGLFNMKERMKEIGGSAVIESKVGQTEVRLKFMA